MKKFFIWILIAILCMFSINIVVFFLDIGLGISKFMPESLINVFINSSRTFDISEYIDLWFSFIGIIVTAILSYLLLKVSQRSNNISEQISNLEKNRDKQILNDSVATIYYQMLYSFKELHKLYIDNFIDNNQSFTNIKLHEDWITILSSTQSKLTINEMDAIYELFIDIENINQAHSNQKKSLIQNTFKKYMLPCFFDSPSMFNLKEVEPISMLKPNMLSILLYLVFCLKQDTLDKINNEKYIVWDFNDTSYNGTIETKNNRFNGKISINYRNLKIDANYIDNKLSAGTIYATYNDKDIKLYEITQMGNGRFYAKFYSDKSHNADENLIIDAEYTDNTFKQGYMKFYNKNELWDGLVEYNNSSYNMITGKVKHRLVEDSTREYNYDAEQQWIAEMEKLQNDTQYQESLADDLENDKDAVGYKIYEDFVYENRKVIKRINRTKENKYSYI